MDAIIIENIKKSYGNKEVLNDVSLKIKKGEVFGLLGVNGAGKTTLLEIIEGIRCCDNGSAQIYGTVGVQLQSSTLQDYIKVKEAINLFALWKKTEINKSDLIKFDIKEIENQYYKNLSTGQKRRLHLFLALFTDPDIIILDEPTAGLDVMSRVLLHKQISELKSKGKTILIASHDMDEIKQFCDRIAIIKSGSVAFVGTCDELVLNTVQSYLIEFTFDNKVDLDNLKICKYVKETNQTYTFECYNISQCLNEISLLAINSNINITNINLIKDSLEVRFVDIANRG